MSFYHNQSGRRIGFLKTYFTTDELSILKQVYVEDLLLYDTLLQDLNDLNSYLKFYPGIGNIFNKVALDPQILEFIAKKLALMDKSEIPIILMNPHYDDENSPIDVACRQNQLKSLKILLELITNYQNDHGFNYLIDNNLVYFIEKGLELSEYFESTLSIFQLKREQLTQEQQDSKDCIQSLNELSITKNVKKNDKIIQFNQQKKQSESQTSIEYYLINLPKTLQKLDLIKALSISQKLEYFDNLTIQTIIKFKWKQYT
ncbi:UNKNOWN [Stylonychia lemnae]|uniref:Uncharacterized protein n=1 Tax=Stylonychia lemnae TaxID=5949 RepID=A0A078AGZ2_STYLE|nr:UNKNOWN [Stylonychia lemnae]|eukprot:CDW81494.1 UNKNOWN [Stylonychia lemnae]